MKEQIDTSKVTRLEVINHQADGMGREYVKCGIGEVELSLQDEGRTLKIFLSDRAEK